MIDYERLDFCIRGMTITRCVLREGNDIYVMGHRPKSFSEEVILIVAADANKIWGPDNESMQSFKKERGV